MDQTCTTCGRGLDEHERHMRFVWPDIVLDASDAIEPEDIWFSAETINDSDLLFVKDLAAFVRVLLPIALDDDSTLTFNLWVAMDEDDLEGLQEIWTDDAKYAEFAYTGLLANRILPWDCMGSPITIGVLDTSQVPYCLDSKDEQVSAILEQTWPAAVLLETLPH